MEGVTSVPYVPGTRVACRLCFYGGEILTLATKENKVKKGADSWPDFCCRFSLLKVSANVEVGTREGQACATLSTPPFSGFQAIYFSVGIAKQNLRGRDDISQAKSIMQPIFRSSFCVPSVFEAYTCPSPSLCLSPLSA